MFWHSSESMPPLVEITAGAFLPSSQYPPSVQSPFANPFRQSVFTKVQLFWVMQVHPTYRRLSKTTAREVCEYMFRFSSLFVLMTAKGIYTYSYRSGETQKAVAPLYRFSLYACYTQLDSTTLVVCDTTTAYLFRLVMNQTTELGQLVQRRLNPGLVCYDGAVYVFGGMRLFRGEKRKRGDPP